MSWNPNQGQDPNQSGQYGGSSPQQPGGPYGGQQGGGYQQPGQGGYSQQQPAGYQQPYGVPPSGNAGSYGPSSMDMDPKTAAGLSYILFWITGLVFFLLEKQNRFVRFHAMQSIILFGGISVLSIVLRTVSYFDLSFMSLLFGCANGLLWIAGFVLWIVLMINGFQGNYFKLPVIGDYAERYANQGVV